MLHCGNYAFIGILSRHRLPCAPYAPFPALTQFRQRLTQNALTTDTPGSTGPLPPSDSLTMAVFTALGFPYYREEHPCSYEALVYFLLLGRSGKIGCPGSPWRLANTSARQHCILIFILRCKGDNAWASHLGHSFPTVLPDQYRATPAIPRHWSVLVDFSNIFKKNA